MTAAELSECVPRRCDCLDLRKAVQQPCCFLEPEGGKGQGRAPHSGAVAAQRADLMGTSWREQDVPNPVENAQTPQLKVVQRTVKFHSSFFTGSCGSRNAGILRAVSADRQKGIACRIAARVGSTNLVGCVALMVPTHFVGPHPFSIISARRFVSPGNRFRCRGGCEVDRIFTEIGQVLGGFSHQNLIDSTHESLESLIPVDSAGPVSFIIEHIMNKWAGRGFTSKRSGDGQISRSGA